jgi:hypothetical protein
MLGLSMAKTDSVEEKKFGASFRLLQRRIFHDKMGMVFAFPKYGKNHSEFGILPFTCDADS